MTIQSRLAVASGAAGAGAATLLLTQRSDGTIIAVLMMVLVARAAASASALRSDLSAVAGAALQRQAAFVPAWVLAVAAASVRAGSTVIGDIAGAHAVTGVALARGPIAAVAGVWLCTAGLAIAIAGSAPAWGTEPAASSVPARTDVLGAAAQIGLASALVAGPQIRAWSDAIPWAAAAVAFGVWAWFGRTAARMGPAPLVAGALCAAGLILVVAGGRG